LVRNDKDWQRELLEEAFQTARRAKVPFKFSVPKGELLGRRQLVNEINALEMDRLSLQCRALQSLVEVDRPRALALVTELEPLQIPLTDCAEPYAPNVDAFYQMLLAVARQGFTTKEQAKNLDLDFVEPYLRQVNHPIQVAPASRLVRFLGTSPARLDRLLNTFLAALDEVRNDDRAFSGGNTLPSAAELLMLGTYSSQHGPRGAEVFARLRGYLVKHLSGSRCSDNVLTANSKPAPTLQIIRDFNQLVEHDQHNIAPIKEDEIKPQAHTGNAAVTEFWRTPTAAKLRQRWFGLTMGEFRPSEPGTNGRPTMIRTTPDRSSADWEQSFKEFLQDVRDWPPEIEMTRNDLGHQKGLLYTRVFDFGGHTPNPRQCQNDLEFLLEIREHFPTFHEWYVHANVMLNRYRSPIYRYPGKSQFLEPFQEALRNTRDPLFQLLVKLDAAFAQK
jgi:hypothetical protein